MKQEDLIFYGEYAPKLEEIKALLLSDRPSVFFEFLRNAGLRKVNIIKRSIPHKLMPTLRDKKTGRFTKQDNPNCKKVYPNEFIIIMKK